MYTTCELSSLPKILKVLLGELMNMFLAGLPKVKKVFLGTSQKKQRTKERESSTFRWFAELLCNLFMDKKQTTLRNPFNVSVDNGDRRAFNLFHFIGFRIE